MQAIRSFTIIIQFLVLTTVFFGLNAKLLDSFEDYEAELNCLKSVFHEYVRPMLASTSSNGQILINLPSSKSTVSHHDYILKEFHQEFAVIVNSSSNEYLNPDIHSKVAIYVLFCTQLVEVTATIDRWKYSIETWNSTASVIIFLKDTSEPYWKIRRILMMSMDSTSLNVKVISIGIKKIEIVTWSKYNGGNLQVVAECILESSSFRITPYELDTNKRSINVHQKLKVIRERSPFTSFNSKLDAGFEAELLSVIADKMQFKPVYIDIPSNSTESFKDFLRNGRADLIISGMFNDASDNRDLSSSVAYSSDDIAWCIASAKQVPRWQNMFRIVPNELWLILCASFYFYCFILYMLLKIDTETFHNYVECVLIVMQTVCALSTNFKPKNACVRLFYTVAIFASITALTTYMAFYIKFMTLPIYMKQVDSMAGIVSNGYELCGQNETLSFYNHHQDWVSSYVQQNYKKCAGSVDDNLAELATNENLAVAVSRLHANNCPLITSHQIFCIQNENIINYPIAIMVKKDFNMLAKINEFLHQAIESGLVQKWKMNFRMYDFKPTESHEPIVLTMEQMFGAFFILSIGMIAALLVIVGEHLMYSYMTSKRCDTKSSFWYTIEQFLFIPERVYCMEKYRPRAN